MPENAAIRVRLVGLEKAVAALNGMAERVDAAQGEGLSEAAVFLKGRVMRNLSGRGDFPQWRTGRLTRGTIAEQARRGGAGWVSRVGTSATVAYGRILEFGGPIPEHDVWAGAFSGRSSKRALAWPASMYARQLFASHLGRRATPKQAQARTRAGTRGTSGFAFATHVTIPARIQRAIPYLAPTLQEEMPGVVEILRRRIGRAVKGGG